MTAAPATDEPLPGSYPPGAEPFLAAVVADPDDDTARLVFADWLQESGDDARAEFIRLQIDLDNGGPAEGSVERQRDLLAGHRAAWLAGYPPWAVAGLERSFRRGFPTAVHATPRQWWRDGDRLRRWLPLEEVSIEGEATECPDAFARPSLVGLKRLALNRIGAAELRALAASAAPASLESLQLAGGQPAYRPYTPPDETALRPLLGADNLSNLRELRVHFDRFGDALGLLVGGSPHLRGLRVLCLSDGMGDGAARRLFDSPNLANVTHLALPHNPIGDSGLRGLVRSKHATALVDLDLRHAALTAESGRLLAAWPGLRGVRYLHLGGNALGLAGLTALCESPYLTALRTLQALDNVSSARRHLAAALPGFARLHLF